MMLSIFQSISLPSTWLRWVKWRGWWQTKSKLRGCLMRRTRQTARSLCTLIFSLCCHWQNDWSLRSGIVKWILSCVSHWAGMSLRLWLFKWFHHVFPHIYVRNQVIFFSPSPFSTIDHGRSHQWVLMLCDVCERYSVSSLNPWSHLVCAYITSWISPDESLADNNKTFITTLFPPFSLLSSVK